MKPSTGADVGALCLSLALHGGLVLAALVAGLAARAQPHAAEALPNSIAMVGNSIEVEAPTPEVAATPAAAAAPVAPVAPAEATPIDVVAPPRDRAPPAGIAPDSMPSQPRRPKPPSKPRAAAPPAASLVASPGAEAPRAPPAAGTFGQEGLAPGVRRLGYAFTRAIPAATPADGAWRELPAGHVGTIRVELEVDANNHLGPLKHWQARPGEPAPPAVLERMVERTWLLLQAGQFALSGSNQPGSERLSIDVELRDGPVEDEGTSDVVNKGFVGATPGHPGSAHFRYGTGRSFEAKVTIVRSGQ